MSRLPRHLPTLALAAVSILSLAVSAVAFTPVVMQKGSTLYRHLTGTESKASAPARVQYTQMVPESQDAPYIVGADADTSTSDGLRQIAYDVCPQALDVGSCLDYTVTVKPLDFAEGQVEVSWKKEGGQTQASTPLQAHGIEVDQGLIGADPQYVAYVAAHEWNHVEQANIARTVGNNDAITKAAHDYYVDRLGPALDKDRLGVEVLTDCMTVEGDNVQVGTTKTGPYYLRTYAGGKTAAEACGDWGSLLSVTP